jgi:transposase-like protein
MNACPKCGCTLLYKSGHKTTKTGRFQQWVCKANKHTFTGQERFHKASEEEKTLALKMVQEGMSIRGAARVVNRAAEAVTQWIKKKPRLPSARMKTLRGS